MGETQISYGRSVFRPDELENKSVKYIFKLIKSEQYKIHTDKLRSLKNIKYDDDIQQKQHSDRIRNYKATNLNYVTWSGTFKGKRNADLVESSGLICLDYDETYNDEKTLEIRELLKQDKHVLCVFTSPSGGLKFICKIPIVKDDSEFKSYYYSIEEHFAKKGIVLDKACKDISRACFLSHDSDIYINEECSKYTEKKRFEPSLPEKSTKTKGVVRNKKHKVNLEELKKALSFLKSDDYNTWISYAFALKNYEKESGVKMFSIFDEWSSKHGEYDPSKTKEKWESINLDREQENPITIATILSDAREKGYCEEKDIISKSFIETPTHLYEQIIIEGAIKYLGFDRTTKEIKEYNQVLHQGVVYKPINGEEVLNKQIKLPTGIKEYVNDKELDKVIDKYIYKWLDIDDYSRKQAVYSVRQSWVYDRFNTLNYLRALGEHATGKSRFLNTLGNIHYKPISTSGALTAAVLFRIINKWKGTLIIDEADRSNSDETDDIITIINQGYEKGCNVMRCDPNDPNKINFFDVYCPKIIGTRRQFEDKATESRCITNTMRQTNRKDIPLTLNDDFEKETSQIRDMLLLWRFQNYDKIDNKAGDIIQDWDIEPRLKQVNHSFVSLFAHDKEEVARFKDWLISYQDEIVESRSFSSEGRIVNAIYELDGEGKTITATNIIDRAHLVTKKGENWQPRALSNVMKQLGFKPAEQKKVNGYNTKVYNFEDDFINNLYKKYIQKGNRVTEVTEQVDGYPKLKNAEKPTNIDNNTILGGLVTTVTSVTRLPSLLSGKILDYLQVFEQIKEADLLNELRASTDFEFSDFEKAIKSLKKKGDIFEPTRGTFRRLD